jgi:hypothetical protein
MILKSIYWTSYEEGSMLPNSVIVLMEIVDTALDYEDKPIEDWTYVYKAVGDISITGKESQFQNWPIVGAWLKKRAFERI